MKEEKGRIEEQTFNAAREYFGKMKRVIRKIGDKRVKKKKLEKGQETVVIVAFVLSKFA